MTEIFIKSRSGNGSVIFSDSNRTLMELIRDGGNDELLALCGGCCACATCHVYIDPVSFEKLPPMSADENDLLDSSDNRTVYSRLSCQVLVSKDVDGMKVQIAEED